MSSSLEKSWLSIAPGLGKLKAAWPSRGWSWDGRLVCASSSFPVEREKEALEATAHGFPTEWSTSQLALAPQRLRDLLSRVGDIWPGQRLFTTGPLDGLYAFGLWWPWNNGVTISLRVGLADVDPDREPTPQLRDLFGVAPD